MSEYVYATNGTPVSNADGEISLPRERIIRCRDCKHMETRGYRRYCGAHAGGYPEVALDDFCSWGERTEGR